VRSDLALLCAVALAACDEKPSGPAPERFAAVKKKSAQTAAAFCDKSPEPGAQKYEAPALRPFGKGEAAAAKGWRWVNLWATWCKPCVEEMDLLNRWSQALSRAGLDVTFEMLSIDEAEAEDALKEWSAKPLPGQIRWIKSADELKAFFEKLGVGKDAPIPVHVLVDPKGSVRCVRVGSIHEENWGPVRALIAGG
jgi:thiol-disulfide isomerase/thioredoxin